MTASDWISATVEAVRKDGPGALGTAGHELFLGAARRIDRSVGHLRGIDIFERDWDVFVVLDACHPQLMADVASEYAFIDPVDTVLSKGSSSPTWMERNFTPKNVAEMGRTAYISANTFTNEYPERMDWFGYLDEVWVDGWDEEIHTIPARAVTDRAIAYHRTQSPDRMLIHYMQPHHPFVPAPDIDDTPSGLADTGGSAEVVWRSLESGEAELQDVWPGYRANLEYVLDDVELLLENVDAERVVISADHSNSLGSWGIYGHHRDLPFSALRRVPWVETTATDTKTYSPEIDSNMAESGEQLDLFEKLRYLGYSE